MNFKNKNNLFIGPAGLITNDFEIKYLELIDFCKDNKFNALEIEFLNLKNLKEYPTKDTIIKLTEKANKYNIKLSIHAPYYINLSSLNPNIVNISLDHISKTLELARICNGPVVIHSGFYNKNGRRDSVNRVIQNLNHLKFKNSNNKSKNNYLNRLYLEIPGKLSVLGSLEELLYIASKIDCSLCIDWAHLYARNPDNVIKNNLIKIIDKIENQLNMKFWHMHISGMKRSEKGEIKHQEFRKSFFPVDIVVNTLKEVGIHGSLICESPARFKHDTLFLLKIYETGKIPYPKLKSIDEFFI